MGRELRQLPKKFLQLLPENHAIMHSPHNTDAIQGDVNEERLPRLFVKGAFASYAYKD